MPSKFWRKRPCLPFSVSDSDFSGRLFVPRKTRPRRPLSNSASTASCNMRFSLRTITSGACNSISFFKRLLRLITRRYKSFKSDVANRPPSRGTSGRNSGGSTGITSRIIHSGLFPLLRNASRTFSRLANLIRFCRLGSVFIFSRSSSESFSTSTLRKSSLIASAPMPARNFPRFSFCSSRSFSSGRISFCFSEGTSPGSRQTNVSKYRMCSRSRMVMSSR